MDDGPFTVYRPSSLHPPNHRGPGWLAKIQLVNCLEYKADTGDEGKEGVNAWNELGRKGGGGQGEKRRLSPRPYESLLR